jgi:tetratricopeptide (TPR) repeat protein
MKVATKRASVVHVKGIVLAVCGFVALCACGAGHAPAAKSSGGGGGGGSTPAGGTGGGAVGDDVADTGPIAAADPVPDDPPVAEDPPVAVSLDLVDTVKTTSARADMSAFLVKPAKAAVDKKDYGKAIVIYSALVVARGPASPEARQLADLWALAGQNEQAVAVLDAYIAAATEPDQITEARAARKRLGAVNDPFAKKLSLPTMKKEADKIFKLGRKAYKKKKYGDALVYYHMGFALSPDLPGFLRELGTTYEKLGAADKKLEFYRRYLFAHPFGKNADDIRKNVKKDKGVLGTLTLSSSLPCEAVLLQGSGAPQQLPMKLPAKKLALAPGRYGVLCFSSKYGLYYRDPVVVTADADVEHEFKWAVIVNALESPLGRISIENSAAGGMTDLGIDTTEHGVVCPDDGHALRLMLTDDAGTRSEERYQKVEPGQRYVIKW